MWFVCFVVLPCWVLGDIPLSSLCVFVLVLLLQELTVSNTYEIFIVNVISDEFMVIDTFHCFSLSPNAKVVDNSSKSLAHLPIVKRLVGQFCLISK